MTESTKNKIKHYLDSLEFDDWCVSDYFSPDDYEDINFDDAYRYIIDYIEDCGGFDPTGAVVYYSKAMEFLQRNDPTLTLSLRLAEDMGYNMLDVDSEILASILKMNMIQNMLYDRADDITAFFYEIQELIHTEDEEEE